MDKLFIQLSFCMELIEKGGTSNIAWLNKFCAVFHKFASKLKQYLPDVAPKNELEGNIKIHVETIFLCFTQVLTCITQLEHTIRLENKLEEGSKLLVTRTHFLDRITWCLRRLQASLYLLSEESIASTAVKLDDRSFVELLDLALDKLETFNEIVSNECLIPLQNHHDLYNEVNHIVRHALAFANVSLEIDKKALNAISETVLEECRVFEKNFDDHNPGNRKLEALSLQRALYSLESFLNEALLRLIFNSFHNMEEISITRLKDVLNMNTSSAEVDKLIADFDVNMDRIQQIGVFAIAFTTDIKTKTIVRSCLASLESLDSCIVPAFQLQISIPASHHADILEQHFKQELVIFRNVIHEIIDSRAMIGSYLDILGESITNAEKLYPKGQLFQISQMGNVLIQQFQLRINYQELCVEGERFYKDFTVILRECQAILGQNEHVDIKRIVKRLKILYTVLSKLRDAIGVEQATLNSKDKSQTRSKNVSERHRTFAKSKNDKTIVMTKKEMASDTLTHEGDLISFQLTEILQIN